MAKRLSRPSRARTAAAKAKAKAEPRAKAKVADKSQAAAVAQHFRVESDLQLGLGLRRGGVYSEAELLRRCGEDQPKRLAILRSLIEGSKAGLAPSPPAPRGGAGAGIPSRKRRWKQLGVRPAAPAQPLPEVEAGAGAAGDASAESQGADAQGERFFRVDRHLHLGLALRLGRTYSEAELQHRCQGDAHRLEALAAFLRGDGEALVRVEAPPAAERRARPRPAEPLAPTEWGPLPLGVRRRGGLGSYQASIYFCNLSIETREMRSLSASSRCQAAMRQVRDSTRQRLATGASFEQALRASVQEVLEGSDADAEADEPMPKWFYHFGLKSRAAQVRTKRTSDFEQALEQWRSIREVVDIPEPNMLRGPSSDAIQEQRIATENKAAEILERLNGAPASTQDVEEVLRMWGFRQNKGRRNVIPDGEPWVHSDTLGLIRRRGFRLTSIRLARGTAVYPSFLRLISSWLQGRWQVGRRPAIKEMPPYTTITINKGYAARRHRDMGNVGPSMLLGAGSFTGGRLRHWPSDWGGDLCALKEDEATVLDVSGGKIALFNGNNAHEVEAFHGERFSVVFWTVQGFHRMHMGDEATLRGAGFRVPTPESLVAACRSCGCAAPAAFDEPAPYAVILKEWQQAHTGEEEPPFTVLFKQWRRAQAHRRKEPKAREPRVPGAPFRTGQETQQTKWYRVQRPPHLGLRLLLGACYSQLELERRCCEDKDRVRNLKKCLRDSSIFASVDSHEALAASKAAMEAAGLAAGVQPAACAIAEATLADSLDKVEPRDRAPKIRPRLRLKRRLVGKQSVASGTKRVTFKRRPLAGEAFSGTQDSTSSASAPPRRRRRTDASLGLPGYALDYEELIPSSPESSPDSV